MLVVICVVACGLLYVGVCVFSLHFWVLVVWVVGFLFGDWFRVCVLGLCLRVLVVGWCCCLIEFVGLVLVYLWLFSGFVFGWFGLVFVWVFGVTLGFDVIGGVGIIWLLGCAGCCWVVGCLT